MMLFDSFNRRTRRGSLALVAIVGLFYAQTLMAQNTYDLDDLGDGQVLLNLSVSEEVQVIQDLLSAVLQFMVRGPDSTALQREVNQAMTQALEILGNEEGLEFHTQQYHVHPVYGRNDDAQAHVEPIWQAQQSVRVSSLDAATVLAVVAQLQSRGFQMQQLEYSLSSAAHREASDALLEAAIARLQHKAQHVAQLLGKSQANIIEVSLNDSPALGLRGMSMARFSTDAADIAPPVAEPGKSTVTVAVSARALISP